MANNRTAEQQALNRQLFAASKKGDVLAIMEALQNGADIDAKDGWYGTALHMAATRGFEDCVKVLLEAGAEVNARNEIKFTPLHAAAFDHRTEAMKVLLAAGADLTLKNKYGNTPAMMGSLSGRGSYLQSIVDDPATRPTPESVGLDMEKRIAALDALGKPLGKFTELEKRRQAQRDTREAQRQEALNSPGGGI